jgi:hypothetical protein
MNLYAPIFNYCERTEIGLLAEPLNAFSNVSFFIAAWLLYRAEGSKRFEEKLLIALIAIIGVGSTLFHTFANGLTMLADIIPISLFTFYYLWVAMRHPLSLSIGKSIIGLLLFTVLSSQIKYLPAEYSFNGSVSYFPALLALLVIGGLLARKRSPAARHILSAALLFILSISLRSMDMMICPSLAIGSHFLWHLINGAVLYLLVKAIHRPASP